MNTAESNDSITPSQRITDYIARGWQTGERPMLARLAP